MPTLHLHDHRCVFSCHIGLRALNPYAGDRRDKTEREKNPWSTLTMGDQAYANWLRKELTAANVEILDNSVLWGRPLSNKINGGN